MSLLNSDPFWSKWVLSYMLWSDRISWFSFMAPALPREHEDQGWGNIVCNYVKTILGAMSHPQAWVTTDFTQTILPFLIFPFSRIILIDIRTCCHFFDLKNNFSCSALLEQEGLHPNKAPLHVVRNWQLASFSRHHCPRLRLPDVSKSCSSSLARLCSLRPCSRESNKQARPSLRVYLAASGSEHIPPRQQGTACLMTSVTDVTRSLRTTPWPFLFLVAHILLTLFSRL